MTHLTAVAKLAEAFASKFGAGQFGYWAGLWHDLGKFNPEFQDYLSGKSDRGPDHSTAGAYHASDIFDSLSWPIAGHHAGLPSRSILQRRFCDRSKVALVKSSIEIARRVVKSIVPGEDLTGLVPTCFNKPPSASDKDWAKRAHELFLRIIFSALVDADFLDTERHFHPEIKATRSHSPSISELWPILEKSQGRLSGQSGSRLQSIRHEIYLHCLREAERKPGLYSLTVPTGGGKTRSGLAFALKHALKHQLHRVIVAIPYTSIIEQTADVYRKIFGAKLENAVLEHHSATFPENARDADPVDYDAVWARLASENWDAPIVVTTTVQLFESLFANRPARCRKLHNLTKSVIILDEVQTLPVHLLAPILEVIQQLVDHYGSSIVLCTATQPALKSHESFRGLQDVREIVPDAERFFRELRRVRYEVNTSIAWPWARVAQEMGSVDQCLAIVNTKKDAFALLDALGEDPAALHLSTQMCGIHRLQALQDIRARLFAGKPCRVVSTQVVEAGVDLDFPLVLRAIGPLDRIVQAAGRCNREMNLFEGRVVIFDPAEGSAPQGTYRTGIDTASSILNGNCDLHDPAVYGEYFRRLFQATDTHAASIQSARVRLDYPEVARQFRMIKDDSVPAIVRPLGYQDKVDSLIAHLRSRREVPRWSFRKLQPFVVSIRRDLIASYEGMGLLQEIIPKCGVWEWMGGYDSTRGLVESARAPQELVI